MVLLGDSQQVVHDVNKQEVELFARGRRYRADFVSIHPHLLEFLQVEALVLHSQPEICSRYLYEVLSDLFLPLDILSENRVYLLQIEVFFVQFHELAHSFPVFFVVTLLI